MNPIAQKVKEAGVVGAGGAGFPTHVKLTSQAEIVIINGAECEPLLKTDQQLAAQYPEQLVHGLQFAMEATGAREGVIALKAKYKSAIKALEPLLQKNMRIAILPDIYPAGDEVMTIWLTTGRRVPPGGLPINIGVVVQNIQTAIQIYQAQQGNPVTSRFLTVAGKVPKPITLRVPLGTSVKDVLKKAGVELSSDLAVIDGGPVMGKLVDGHKAVAKTTGGLIVLPKTHPLIQSKEKRLEAMLRLAKTVCEQCQRCTELCPRHLIGHGLYPHLLIRAVNYNHIGDPQILTGALLCSECGVCEKIACPVEISPRQVNVALKQKLRAQGVKYSGSLHNVDPMAEYRLIPTSRMLQQLGLKDYYAEAPLTTEEWEPEEVNISLQQHIGAPAKPLVQVGDRVVRGQLLADIPENALGAKIHSSIDGIVKEIGPDAIRIIKGGDPK